MPFNKASRLCWSAYDWKGQARRHGDEANRDYESINKLSHVPALRTGLPIFGKRWTGLILDTLMDGPRRFCELTSTVEGLSDRVLSDRLRELEVEGIVERIVYPQIPVRVEYRLTEKGRDLKSVVQSIHTWAEKWISLPETATADK